MLDRESIRSEGKSGFEQNFSLFEENSWLFDENKGDFGKIQLFRSRILFLGQALIIKNQKKEFIMTSLVKKLGLKDFRANLLQIKKKANVDFEWYPYESLNNFTIINDVLKNGKQENFFQELDKNKPILDIGCADGDVAFLFESLGFFVDVIDRPATNFNDLKACKFLKSELNSKINILEYDVDRNLELKQDYGFTFAMGILYHLRNPFYFLNMLCLRSEYVLISTRIASHAPDGTKIKNLSVAYLVGAEELNNDPTNYWIFSLKGIRQLIKRSGFNIVCEHRIGEVDKSTPHIVYEDERYFALLKRIDNYKDIFNHHHF
ncbi:hypothetical protein MNBD_GAMMA01-232 [hydrothermal vent metagenome]|uniref:Methyltransferase domain-containing protein n=1 Tax=hydrothermal vent metagenome TaxID=652676 RepID=A0A3B0V5D1_9ZZZZ